MVNDVNHARYTEKIGKNSEEQRSSCARERLTHSVAADDMVPERKARRYATHIQASSVAWEFESINVVF